MTGHPPSDERTLIHQIRSHLVYELKWLIFAADAFQRAEGGSYVAFLDSAAVHARNLFEFAKGKKAGLFTLHALGGRAKRSDAWDRWANNRVTHMTYREADKAPWPEGGERWDDPDKLMRMARAVLDRLRDGGASISPGPVRDAFDEVLEAAERYWTQPDTNHHAELAALYDDSRDLPYPT